MTAYRSKLSLFCRIFKKQNRQGVKVTVNCTQCTKLQHVMHIYDERTDHGKEKMKQDKEEFGNQSASEENLMHFAEALLTVELGSCHIFSTRQLRRIVNVLPVNVHKL